MRSPLLGEDMLRVLPVIQPGGSDSQMLDNTLEFLYMNGMPLPLAGMVLLPEPWQGQTETTPWRDLYRYYSTMMEPWDGPRRHFVQRWRRGLRLAGPQRSAPAALRPHGRGPADPLLRGWRAL